MELQLKIYSVKEKKGFALIFQGRYLLIFFSSVADILHFQPGNTDYSCYWYTDHTGRVSIGVIPDCLLAPKEVEKDDGFVAAEIGGVTYCNCYFSPNRPIREFNAYLARLEGSTSRRDKVVMASDFNMQSEKWFASHTDRKGVLLSEFATVNRLIRMNGSTNPTPFHQGFGSHIDVIFASENLARQIKGWAIPDGESGSDHNNIHFTVERRIMVPASKKAGRWANNEPDPARLEAVILVGK